MWRCLCSASVEMADTIRDAPAPRGVLRRLAGVIIAIGAFVVMAGEVRDIVPAPPDAASVKWRAFEAHKDEWTGVFIGSSRVHWSVDPAVVDRVLGEHGIESRSFNFGTPGSTSLPDLGILRRVLASEPARLQWVVIDPEMVQVEIAEQNVDASQTVFWHDPATTWLALRLIERSHLERSEKLVLAWQHARSAVRRFVSYGYAGEALRAALAGKGVDGGRRKLLLGHARNGFISLDELMTLLGARRREAYARERAELLEPEGRKKFLDAVEHLRRWRPEENPNPDAALVTRELVRACDRSGVRLVFLIGPSTNLRSEWLGLVGTDGFPELLRFNDPGRFPELYEPPHMFDPRHLNEQGAAIYSEYLGGALAEALGTPEP